MGTHWGTIAERVVGDVVILDVSVRAISLSEGSGRLLDKIHDLLTQGWRKILLDLLDVKYIDGFGLGEIVHGCKAAMDARGVLKLCGGQRIRDLFIANKLDRYVEVFDAEGPALASFAASQ